MILRDYLQGASPGSYIVVQMIDKETGIPITLAVGEAWQTDVFENCRSRTIIATHFDVRYNEVVITVK